MELRSSVEQSGTGAGVRGRSKLKQTAVIIENRKGTPSECTRRARWMLILPMATRRLFATDVPSNLLNTKHEKRFRQVDVAGRG